MGAVVRIWTHLLRSKGVGVFILTYLAYATLYATRKPFSVVKTRVQNELKLSTGWLGLIDTAFLGSYALGQIIIPVLVSRLPMRNNTLLMLLYGGSGIVSTIFGLSSSATALALLWVANGFLHSAVFPLLVACVSPHFPAARRGQVMGTWTTSQQVGATVATLFAAYVSERMGWRSVFIIPGVFTVAFGFFLQRNLSSPPLDLDDTAALATQSGVYASNAARKVDSKMSSPAREIELTGSTQADWNPVEEDMESQSPKDLGGGPRSMLDLMRIPDIKAVSLCYFCVKCVRYSLLFWLPYYLATELRYSADVAGYASVMFDLGGIFGGILTGQIADRLCGGRRILVAAWSCVASALSLLLFAWASRYSTFVALALMGLVGFTVAASDSIIGGSAASDLCDRAGISGPSLSATSGTSSFMQHTCVCFPVAAQS